MAFYDQKLLWCYPADSLKFSGSCNSSLCKTVVIILSVWYAFSLILASSGFANWCCTVSLQVLVSSKWVGYNELLMMPLVIEGYVTIILSFCRGKQLVRSLCLHPCGFIHISYFLFFFNFWICAELFFIRAGSRCCNLLCATPVWFLFCFRRAVTLDLGTSTAHLSTRACFQILWYEMWHGEILNKPLPNKWFHFAIVPHSPSYFVFIMIWNSSFLKGHYTGRIHTFFYPLYYFFLPFLQIKGSGLQEQSDAIETTMEDFTPNGTLDWPENWNSLRLRFIRLSRIVLLLNFGIISWIVSSSFIP